jgi:hypothetical protein
MSSHASAPVTTSLLTILCIALVHHERPDWLAVGVGEAARAAALSPERVSRLASRVAKPFADIVESLTRRGRPPRVDDPLRAELVTLRALLAVASAALALVSLRRPAVRALLVGAWRHLSTDLPSLTKSAFCKALSLPERTLRHWLAHPPAAHTTPPPSPPSPPPPPPQRPLRRPRFRFDVFLPGTQVGADTTDLSVFGVPLKLVGVQDIGGRDRRLFESVVIDTRECADHVVDALRVVLRDCPGIQALTDQGTPYMAAATKLALDELQAEHAPQKEGDPTGKSTVERGFGSLKDVLSPLLSLTDRLAELVPSLRSPDLAIPFARLLAGCALRAYQAGARATRRAVEATGNASEDTLVRAAARAREAARSTDRSARLLLAHLHGLFLFSTSATRFVEQYRRYPLEVLRSAEASLRTRFLMRGAPDVREVDRYFAALVRNHFAEHRRRRATVDASRSLQQRLRQQHHEADHAERSRSADPALWLRQALDLIALQWLPIEQHLLFDGHGLGVGWMRAALDLLLRRHGCTATTDIAAGVLGQFRLACLPALGDDGVDAVAALLERELAQAHARHQPDLAHDPASAIPRAIGLSTRPAPPNPLRN